MQKHHSNNPVPPGSRPGYRPLEQYGMIGNLHTVALVANDGSIDWCCMPHFDSPSLFGALLDTEKGGFFRIAPRAESARRKQFYLADSNVLLTHFLSAEGVGELMDFMPVRKDSGETVQHHRLYRIVRAVRGTVRFRLECFPAFNYARDSHKTYLHKEGVVFESSELAIGLQAPVPFKKHGSGVIAEFDLKAGQEITFILCMTCPQDADARGITQPSEQGRIAFEETLAYWQLWISHMRYHGRWREMVTRSALVLKMLTFAPTGAIVASPTTSLPEVVGGKRNWDYRYNWIRDASFTLYALLRLGFSEEAHAFMGFLRNRLDELGPEGRLQIMYGIHGQHRLTEKALPYLEGYEKSSPVRIGNGAYDQLQLDIYGELMDSVYLFNKYGTPISYDLWRNLRKLLGYVCRHWRNKDRGIWEVRSGNQHFVYSKVMCWVALDRGLRLAEKRSFPADWGLWTKNRDAIYQDVMTHGWDAKHQSFVQHYGTSATDASTLIMPLVKFISPTDPRMVATLERIKKTLISDNLVHRYEIGQGIGDGLSGSEGTFSMCTFWFAEALARAGQVREGREIFERMLGYASPLGLYSEEIGPTGELLGNFPQAFTHLGLISAAYNIDKALNKPTP